MAFPSRAAAAFALLCASGAAAEPASGPLPAEIQKQVDRARQECRDQGATLKLGDGFARSADFNGDGVADYVVDDAALECVGAISLYCGSAGCSGALYLSGKDGRFGKPAVAIQQYAMTIDRSGKLPTLVVEQRGPKLVFRWDGRKMISSRR